jgi:putative glycosyltransferase (TIGR04372 family)
MKKFIAMQISEVRRGDYSVLTSKIKRFLWILLRSPLYVLALPSVLVLRIIRPWMLVRFNSLMSSRIGHFAANIELYMCEHDANINRPDQRHIDLFYFGAWPICNKQLAKMWKRTIHIWPAWIIAPIVRINRLIPNGAVHEIGNNTQNDRDVHSLLDKTPPHLAFTEKEEVKGQANLILMGIPLGAKFICLIVRDSAYLENQLKREGDWSYHDYRDCDVKNYVLVAEALADLGYYVIRMGVKVNEAINSDHPLIIDYATNGMRNDFMDIYLGAKCAFCLSNATGFDAVPSIFRRPIAFVNFVPVEYFPTFSNRLLGIFKHHFSIKSNRNLSLREILMNDAGSSLMTSNYESKDILLIENTPEEIRDVAIEMHERINGTWQLHDDDELLQQKFWEIFPVDAVDINKGVPIHGLIHSRFGASFLRNNQWWLE